MLFSFQVSVIGDDKLYSDEPDGFKLVDYRSPVPLKLTDATTLTTEALEALLFDSTSSSQPLLIDVLPAIKKPEWWPQGQVWLPEPHKTIAGSYWLPEVGFGTINPQVELLFKGFLVRKTLGNKGHPIVLFCKENCWISWNAAKRLLNYGYNNIYWYPDGIDGWNNTLNSPEVVEVFDLRAE